MTQVVAKELTMEIITRIGLPISLGSSNGLVFMAKLSQVLIICIIVRVQESREDEQNFKGGFN